jgi:hypothetical protein
LLADARAILLCFCIQCLFSSLGIQQENQRKIWSKELALVETEIFELKEKLGLQIQKRNSLRQLLGLPFNSSSMILNNMEMLKNNVQKVAKKSVTHLAKEFQNLFHDEVTKEYQLLQNETKSDKNSNSIVQPPKMTQ